MRAMLSAPPHSDVEPVTEILHGIPVTDPYRWLEDQHSLRTRAWIDQQTIYARGYLDSIRGRERIRRRVRELLDVETFDSFLKCRNRYFFRKRLPGEEQPSIYFREGAYGEDQLLIDPAWRGTGEFTAVKPLRLSHDGSLLLYEVKQGGERMGTFEIFDVKSRKTLPDSLPHGYLRGFAFAPDGKSFLYVHEAADTERPFYPAAYHHALGTSPNQDSRIFSVGENEKCRLALVSSDRTVGFLLYRFLDKTYTDFYIWPMGSAAPVIPVLRDADYSFVPHLVRGLTIAAIDQGAPNRRIIEVQARENAAPLYFDLIPETDAPINRWVVTQNHIVVSYVRGTRTDISVFDHLGKPLGEIPCDDRETLRIVAASSDDDEVLLERESFSQPIEILRCTASTGQVETWARCAVPFDSENFAHIIRSFPSKDGTSIPMFMFAHANTFGGTPQPVIMTAYGGYGVPMTPQFSVLVAILIEQGCLFALPNIRGGSEFGTAWHEAAKRRKRPVAFGDFIAAAEWLIATGWTESDRLAIFGGSNSGLLVGAAITQRPDLFRAALCMVPILDMLRYHLFDNAHVWKDEFGTADDPEDFRVLLAYSPYNNVRDGKAYPAMMFVSGDCDQNCNSLHARKMTARIQAANTSDQPIFLDYNRFRGHSPVLPLSTRVDALTDRIAFLCDQLRLSRYL